MVRGDRVGTSDFWAIFTKQNPNNAQNKQERKIMNALILGGGGREQALAWKISQSPLIDILYLAPGNGGSFPKCLNVALSEADFPAIADFVKKHDVELLVVGPEQPLVDGIVDFLAGDADLAGLHIVGPTAFGARLESSKAFAKEFMARQGIKTAAYKSFSGEGGIEAAADFIRGLGHGPYVLKADGLAAGKGVLIIEEEDEAVRASEEMLRGKFGEASRTVVIEEFLSGIECSVFFLTDGKSYTLLPVAKDYKRIGDGDTGLNTGGMGSVSPVPFANKDFMDKVEREIVQRTVDGISPDVYKGFVFLGLMDVEGEPFVIEYNVRMGDPETESVMRRIDGDLVPYLLALKEEKLGDLEPLKETEETALTLILASGGYPEKYAKGFTISGIEEAEKLGAVVFHAGTKSTTDGGIVTAGGRVLAVSATGYGLEEAREKAYAAAEAITFEKVYKRNDIGSDLLAFMKGCIRKETKKLWEGIFKREDKK